jgi:hypothetical protein
VHSIIVGCSDFLIHHKSKREGPRSGSSRVGYAHHVSIPAQWICKGGVPSHHIITGAHKQDLRPKKLSTA